MELLEQWFSLLLSIGITVELQDQLSPESQLAEILTYSESGYLKASNMIILCTQG